MERIVPRLTIVIPCYNEEQVLPETTARLGQLLTGLIQSGRVHRESYICLVDDGSTDATWPMTEELSRQDSMFTGIKLSRNSGQQHALLAGLMTAPGEALITVDADLQDDLQAIGDMVDAYSAGFEVVYGVRRGRLVDPWWKRMTAESYYRLLASMGVEIVFNHADYRLLSRRAVEALREFKESNLFLRGLIPQLGFKTTTVLYERRERFAGESKYPLRKMLSLAIDGITSFSAAPLRWITVMGIVLSIASFGTGTWALVVRLTNPHAVPGWASTVVPIYLLGGIQLLAIGIIGQYIAKIYIEVKARPRFLIEKVSATGSAAAALAAPDHSRT
jgi:polyisoprenyl-phosphate glycosyltransferase